MPSALLISLTMPPPMRNFRPDRSAMPVIGRLVLKTMPGPWVNTASTFTPLCSSCIAGDFAKTRWKATEVASAESPRKGNSAICVVTKRPGV